MSERGLQATCVSTTCWEFVASAIQRLTMLPNFAIRGLQEGDKPKFQTSFNPWTGIEVEVFCLIAIHNRLFVPSELAISVLQEVQSGGMRWGRRRQQQGMTASSPHSSCQSRDCCSVLTGTGPNFLLLNG